MHKSIVAAIAAATLAYSVPATAQQLPLNPGDYWQVSSIEVKDGHAADYADYLAGQYRTRMDAQRAKGWIKGYHIMSNVNPREGEADLYLITIFDHVPNAAEQMARDKEMSAMMKTTSRADIASSGVRASYRTLKGTKLLQEMLWAH